MKSIGRALLLLLALAPWGPAQELPPLGPEEQPWVDRAAAELLRHHPDLAQETLRLRRLRLRGAADPGPVVVDWYVMGSEAYHPQADRIIKHWDAVTVTFPAAGDPPATVVRRTEKAPLPGPDLASDPELSPSQIFTPDRPVAEDTRLDVRFQRAPMSMVLQWLANLEHWTVINHNLPPTTTVTLQSEAQWTVQECIDALEAYLAERHITLQAGPGDTLHAVYSLPRPLIIK